MMGVLSNSTCEQQSLQESRRRGLDLWFTERLQTSPPSLFLFLHLYLKGLDSTVGPRQGAGDAPSTSPLTRWAAGPQHGAQAASQYLGGLSH